MSRFDRTQEKTKRSRSLRSSMPSAELILWTRLKNRQLNGFRFRRQHPVGTFFLDFYCAEIRLCIELDGDQHGHESGLQKDQRRTKFLSVKDISVLRFWNTEVYNNLDSVLESILEQALYLRKESETSWDRISSP